MAVELPSLRLRANAERRLRAGHLWIYSNEVDIKATPLKTFAPGAQVRVETHTGKPVGIAYVNPNTLICARLVSRDARVRLDASLLEQRLKLALALRERIYPGGCYRLVYGESDLLPGLIVDRYGDYLVVQLNTAGMESVREVVVEALEKLLGPRGILLRNDSGAREPEGLASVVEVAQGEVPEQVPLCENGMRFLALPHTGQKTGWFYDHRDNRAQLARYAPGSRVLDVFSYLGGWGVQAACLGACEVLCLDSSDRALEGVFENAALNGVQEKVRTERGQSFELMKALVDAGERFDLVIVDPPAFIKRRKDLKSGTQAYHRLNELAMRLIGRDGVVISASCSMHLAQEALTEILRSSARHLDRHAQILGVGSQSADHPIHPAIPETAYLKCAFVRVAHL